MVAWQSCHLLHCGHRVTCGADTQSIRYVLISETVVKGEEPAHYFSRGQRVQFVNLLKEENDRLASRAGGAVAGDRNGGEGEERIGDGEAEEEEGVDSRLRAYG